MTSKATREVDSSYCLNKVRNEEAAGKFICMPAAQQVAQGGTRTKLSGCFPSPYTKKQPGNFFPSRACADKATLWDQQAFFIWMTNSPSTQPGWDLVSVQLQHTKSGLSPAKTAWLWCPGGVGPHGSQAHLFPGARASPERILMKCVNSKMRRVPGHLLPSYARAGGSLHYGPGAKSSPPQDFLQPPATCFLTWHLPIDLSSPLKHGTVSWPRSHFSFVLTHIKLITKDSSKTYLFNYISFICL